MAEVGVGVLVEFAVLGEVWGGVLGAAGGDWEGGVGSWRGVVRGDGAVFEGD